MAVSTGSASRRPRPTGGPGLQVPQRPGRRLHRVTHGRGGIEADPGLPQVDGDQHERQRRERADPRSGRRAGAPGARLRRLRAPATRAARRDGRPGGGRGGRRTRATACAKPHARSSRVRQPVEGERADHRHPRRRKTRRARRRRAIAIRRRARDAVPSARSSMPQPARVAAADHEPGHEAVDPGGLLAGKARRQAECEAGRADDDGQWRERHPPRSTRRPRDGRMMRAAATSMSGMAPT